MAADAETEPDRAVSRRTPGKTVQLNLSEAMRMQYDYPISCGTVLIALMRMTVMESSPSAGCYLELAPKASSFWNVDVPRVSNPLGGN